VTHLFLSVIHAIPREIPPFIFFKSPTLHKTSIGLIIADPTIPGSLWEGAPTNRELALNAFPQVSGRLKELKDGVVPTY
jgi:hypothetical protein